MVEKGTGMRLHGTSELLAAKTCGSGLGHQGTGYQRGCMNLPQMPAAGAEGECSRKKASCKGDTDTELLFHITLLERL